MSEPIRVVLFDAAETLFHVNGSVADIYLRHAVTFGFQAKPDSSRLIAEAFRRAFHDAPPPVFAATDSSQIKHSERGTEPRARAGHRLKLRLASVQCLERIGHRRALPHGHHLQPGSRGQAFAQDF